MITLKFLNLSPCADVVIPLWKMNLPDHEIAAPFRILLWAKLTKVMFSRCEGPSASKWMPETSRSALKGMGMERRLQTRVTFLLPVLGLGVDKVTMDPLPEKGSIVLSSIYYCTYLNSKISCVSLRQFTFIFFLIAPPLNVIAALRKIGTSLKQCMTEFLLYPNLEILRQ